MLVLSLSALARGPHIEAGGTKAGGKRAIVALCLDLFGLTVEALWRRQLESRRHLGSHFVVICVGHRRTGVSLNDIGVVAVFAL